MLLRILLQVVLLFAMLSAVIALASSGTGIVEKGLLVLVVGVLVWLAALVRRIGAPRPT
jgi:hypothetical protein